MNVYSSTRNHPNGRLEGADLAPLFSRRSKANVSMNKTVLIGNVGRNPELRHLPVSGHASATFSLAVSPRWTDKSTGERKEETTWFTIVACEPLAEECSQSVHKGDQLLIEGRLTSREYDDNGVERATWDVVMTHMEPRTAQAAI